MTKRGAFDNLVDSYLDLRWHFDPVDATAAGLREHDHRLATYGDRDVTEHLVALRSIANAIEEIELECVQDEIDRTALLNEIRFTVHRFTVERPHVRNPTFWVSHILDGLYFMLSRTDRPRQHRAQAALQRLEAVPGLLETAQATISGCPRVFVETAQNVVAGGLALVEEVGLHLRPQDADRFDETREAAESALQSFSEYLATTLSSSPGSDFAIGEDAFDYRLQFEHALPHTAAELWRYGSNLVAEVERELVTVAREIDPSTPWQDLVERLRNDHPSADELAGVYADEMARARDFVEARGLVSIPQGGLDVVETPSFLLPLIPFAAYQPPGAFAEDRTGLFYVSRPSSTLDESYVRRRLRDHCYYEIASTSLHEGYPGHHLQFLIAQAQPRATRKLIGTPLTYEGWALYCEDMMGEEGFYRGAEEQFFQRLALLWRAVRIVVDVGLHTRGMSFDDAVQLLVDRLHFDRGNAEAEVRRYCAEPAYQLCYAVGRRELKALRSDFQNAHGSGYSLRTFHDTVLQYGGLPVTLIRWGLGL